MHSYALARAGSDVGDVGFFGIGKALKKASRAVKKTVRKATRIAKSIAPTALDVLASGSSFVPGIGSTVSAGLAGSAALARGKSIAQIGRAAALGALPGGPLAQAALRAGLNVASGQRIDRALLAGASQAMPGGALGRGALAAGLSLARGERLDRVAMSAARTAAAEGLRGAVRSLPLRSVDPLARLSRGRSGLSPLPSAVHRARKLLAMRPALLAAGAPAISKALGMSTQAARRAAREPMAAPRWMPLSFKAAYAARAAAPALGARFFGRDVAGVAADGVTWTIKSGDTLSGIAQRLTGSAGRWREIVTANPDKPRHSEWGLRLNPGDVIVIPPDWNTATAPPELAAAVVLQSKGILALWGQTDGAREAGASDYGARAEDASAVWGARDRLQLASFAAWHNALTGGALATDGDLRADHVAVLVAWAEAHASRAAVPVLPEIPIPSPVTPDPPPPAPISFDPPTPFPGIPGVYPPPPTPAPLEPPPSGAAPAPIPTPDYLRDFPQPIPTPDDLRAEPLPALPAPGAAAADDDGMGLLVAGALAAAALLM